MIVTSDRYATVLLFGAPGVGKGTQGKILAQVPGFYHMSTGDMFRTLDTHTGIGQQIMDFMSRGELVPDELTIKLDHCSDFICRIARQDSLDFRLPSTTNNRHFISDV